MSLKEQKNKEAELVWDILQNCELSALFNDYDEKGREQYLRAEYAKIPRSKDFARKAIRRIMNSGKISEYVTALIKELHLKHDFKQKGETNETNK